MAQQGNLVLPAPEFAAVVVEPPVSESPIKQASCPEIIVGSVTFRMEEGVSAASVAAYRLRHSQTVSPTAARYSAIRKIYV